VPAGGRSASYAPAPADVGHELRVIVTPGAPGGARGEPAAAAVAGAVEPGPAARAADERADAVPTWTTPPRLRVVTYNLLADQYAASDYAKAHLFNHCPPHHLDPAYRRSLAAQELLAYAGDILFLQEVDEKAFEGVLEPVLAAAGYDGRMTAKASTVREGAALFWRADRFKLVAWRTVVLKDLFGALWAAEEGEGCGSDHLALAARHAALLPALASSPALRDALAKVSTIAQVALLAPVEGGGGGDDGPILATNTHLFFHPAAPHIRTLHVAAMLAEAADVGARALAAGEIKEPATPLFCGDLNSDLNDGIPGTVELLREGALARGFWDWGLGAGFRYDDDGAAPSEGGPLPAPTRAAGDGLAPPDLTIPFTLSPADALATPYTNYVRSYSGLLDYVWADPRALRAVGVVPPRADFGAADFLPNAIYPSDHLAVVADLEWVARPQRAHGPPPPPGRGARGRPPPRFAPAATLTRADDAGVAAAALALRGGALVIVPTDTLYGVAADACSPSALRAVYEAKGRDGGAPLAVAVADVPSVASVGDASSLPPGLLDALLPGPVTVVLTRREDAPVSRSLNPGVAAVAIRVPNSPFILALARAHGSPIALTSANASGQAPALTVGEAGAVAGAAAVVVDGGAIPGGRAGSTVVDLTAVRRDGGAYAILREGEAGDSVRGVLGRFGLVEAV
jgi:2',5'-phosphodiesterase